MLWATSRPFVRAISKSSSRQVRRPRGAYAPWPRTRKAEGHVCLDRWQLVHINRVCPTEVSCIDVSQSTVSGGCARLADGGSRPRRRGWPGNRDQHAAVPKSPALLGAHSEPVHRCHGTLAGVAKTAVFHVTSFTTGPEFWMTGTDEGVATFTPDDPQGAPRAATSRSGSGSPSTTRTTSSTSRARSG